MLLEENLVVADRFKLVRLIGRGGMGSVWQAVHLALDQPCAVKFIEGEVGNVADAHARFQREAKAAAQLRSPHVVQILDHGVWQGRPYIAMELLEGEDLGRAMARTGGKLPLPHLNTIVQQVCRALTKAHQGGIVHRDLKPDNIFLVQDDDRPLVKILDFGVAKQTSQAIDGSNTKTGALLGTPYYMSPEQAQGIKTVDARSDLWSLAVIVYQCVTGERPFDSEALGDLLVKIIVHPVPVPSRVAQVPSGFDAWWARAAERNPDNRFPTAKEFGNSLSVALGLTTDLNAITSSTGAAMSPRGTAMMVHQAPPAPQQATPQPAADARASYPGPPPAPHAQTPQPYGPPPGSPGPGPNTAPQGSAPSPSHPSWGNPGSGLGGTGNPATFSGVEPPYTVPKKSPPIALFAVAFGALAVIGLVGAGYAFTRHPTVAAAGSSSAAPPPEAPSAIAALPTPSAIPEPSATTSVAVPTPSAEPSAAGATPVTGAVAAATPTVAKPALPTGPAKATASAKPPPAASSARRLGDDRKW